MTSQTATHNHANGGLLIDVIATVKDILHSPCPDTPYDHRMAALSTGRARSQCGVGCCSCPGRMNSMTALTHRSSAPHDASDEGQARTAFGHLGSTAPAGVSRRCRAPELKRSRRPTMLKPHVMEITVEGDVITEDELNDGSWRAFEVQRKFSRRNTSAATTSVSCTEGASPEETAKKPPRYRARQPTLTRRRPLQKLPEEHLKVVIRPQGAINMRDCGSAAVLQAVCAAIDADAEDVLKNDQITVHRINNTAIISTPSLARAQAYKDINSLKFDGQDYRMLTYVRAPDNSTRGVFYHAWSGEGDAQIYKELQERNPGLKLAGARRLASYAVLIISLSPDAPSSLTTLASEAASLLEWNVLTFLAPTHVDSSSKSVHISSGVATPDDPEDVALAAACVPVTVDDVAERPGGFGGCFRLSPASVKRALCPAALVTRTGTELLQPGKSNLPRPYDVTCTSQQYYKKLFADNSG
ncbi:hypothetical protein HPB49_011390 [Dermacentor silvarum]|uniref:Uncharacterized protein n=1 Tax=Dermacentor silvarum TaxID=543639 RepID=A0ACB8DCT5_DERSI|nr:hypothetical protein HPB49_011390 [Dermacentor silvarum]